MIVLWVVLDEAALRRPVGDADVARGQLQHLIDLARTASVSLQVQPLRYGAHAASGGAFTILRFADPDLPNVVYVEQLVSALYLDKTEHVDRYTDVMSHLCVESHTPEASISFLEKLLSEV